MWILVSADEMDYASLPHFWRMCSVSSWCLQNASDNCFSLDHPFHQLLYNYIKHQSSIHEPARSLKQGSVHLSKPELAAKEMDIAKNLDSDLHKFDYRNRLHSSHLTWKSMTTRTRQLNACLVAMCWTTKCTSPLRCGDANALLYMSKSPRLLDVTVAALTLLHGLG